MRKPERVLKMAEGFLFFEWEKVGIFLERIFKFFQATFLEAILRYFNLHSSDFR